MTEALDHSGAISAAQHASQTTGDLHPEYVQETLLDSLIPDPLARVISKTHATSGTTAFSANITGDTQVRTAIQASGGYVWGSGAAAVDVVLSRIAADKLGLAAGDTWQSDTAEHDHINEKTTDHGVVIDSVPLKDGLVDGRDVSADGATLDDHNARHEPGGADAMAVDAAAATGSLRTIGTTATAACAGNDARLSDARTPAAHKDSHDPNDGADPLDTAAPANIDGVQAAGVGTAHTLARADHAHRIQHAIADNALLTVDQADAADNDFAKFTASGLEGRSYQEAKADLGLPLYREVTITIPSPATNDDFTIRIFDEAVTLFEVASVIVAGTSVVFNLYHGNDRSAAGTKALTNDVTENNKTTGTVTTGAVWADATVNAGDSLRMKLGTVTGTVTEFSATIRYYLS